MLLDSRKGGEGMVVDWLKVGVKIEFDDFLSVFSATINCLVLVVS